MGSRHPVVVVLLLSLWAAPQLRSEGKPGPLKFVTGATVKVQDEFWSPILSRNEDVTIPYLLQKAEETGIIDNFSRAGGLMPGDFRGLPNGDEVLYKSIEAASYRLERNADPKLDAYLDGLIKKIATAQEADGYLLTHRTIALARDRSGKAAPRWSNLAVNSELHACGALYEAAAAHYRATGKTNLLNVAVKNADLLVRLFGPDKRRDVCGHANVEQALLRLYEVTARENYWRLARFFVDERGRAIARQPRGAFSQDHKPVVYHDEAVGHVTSAGHLYSAAADIARTSEEPLYLGAVERLWTDLMARKLHLTGILGSQRPTQTVVKNYELDHLTSFTEGCAAVSFSMWNQRMFRLTGDAKYLDALERTLYNNLLAGVSLTGDQFFYASPVESDGVLKFNQGTVPKEFAQAKYADAAATRKPWFVSACCPPNLARYLEQVPSLIYATSSDDILVNLFIGSEVTLERNGGRKLTIRQQTRYPWDGKVSITVMPEAKERVRLGIRIPGWSRNTPVPSDLYTFFEGAEGPELSVTLNKQNLPLDLKRGFLWLDREWSPGDSLEVSFTMPVHRVVCNAAVKGNINRVALQRGPLVYCAEALDNRGAARNLALQDDASLHARFQPELLNGVMTIFGLSTTQRATRAPASTAPTRGSRTAVSRTTKLRPLLAIPYYAWGNRGPAEMVVWLWREQ